MANRPDINILKKNDIITVDIDACRTIDNYGYLYYMNLYGEKTDSIPI